MRNVKSEEILDKNSLHALLNYSRDMCRVCLDERFGQFVHLSELIKNPSICPKAYAWFKIAEKLSKHIYS